MRSTVAGMVLAAFGAGGPVSAQVAPPWIRVSPSSPKAAGVHTMAYDSVRGVMVLLGGESRTETWEWDGTTWMLRASPGYPHNGATLAFDSARGVTVAYGGPFCRTWEWDGVVWTERQVVGPRPRSILSHSMAFDSRRNVTVVHGGWEPYEIGETWEWNGVAWARVGGTIPKASPTMAFDPDRGVCVLYGGQNWPPTHSDTQEWNGVAWQVRATTGTPGSVYHSMAYDPDARVTLLYGGSAQNSWEWSGTAWREHGPEGGPSHRSHAAMAYDTRRRRMVLVGGFDCNQQDVRDTWERVSIAGWCYPNCDGSSTPPVLNVADFICYVNRYAAGDPYANCDDYCPGLNVADFTCFLNKFAAGCP